ncbi:hypothetical protein FN846DRAFT_886005 [Sphaerosporella brunnea]|uniref:Uncharacterized protein n=1 Tax=Sphaerosporella brunnea TaxID=1250544 RepID=A0A5J5FB30_9PEZI|nr:hypothetical protein FN846DRAFT_886005 [Sphaerosporella brunnea]
MYTALCHNVCSTRVAPITGSYTAQGGFVRGMRRRPSICPPSAAVRVPDGVSLGFSTPFLLLLRSTFPSCVSILFPSDIAFHRSSSALADPGFLEFAHPAPLRPDFALPSTSPVSTHTLTPLHRTLPLLAHLQRAGRYMFVRLPTWPAAAACWLRLPADYDGHSSCLPRRGISSYALLSPTPSLLSVLRSLLATMSPSIGRLCVWVFLPALLLARYYSVSHLRACRIDSYIAYLPSSSLRPPEVIVHPSLFAHYLVLTQYCSLAASLLPVFYPGGRSSRVRSFFACHNGLVPRSIVDLLYSSPSPLLCRHSLASMCWPLYVVIPSSLRHRHLVATTLSPSTTRSQLCY